MKILFTGGGSGGHFYPIIAVAEKLNKILERENVVSVELYYMSTEPYDEGLLADNRIKFKQVTAGKMRAYFSVQNFFDLFDLSDVGSSTGAKIMPGKMGRS